jgi:DNA repair protein RadA/Sms
VFTELAKRSGVPVVLTGHVTKDGGIAGPRLLEHAVDVVLHLGGEAESGLRLLQGVKNRYGPTNEVGVFEMGESGLSGVADPSRVFLAHRREGAPGSAVATLIEGTRALTVEVQALTSPSTLPNPRRVATGVDLARLHLVLAVLSRRLGMAVHLQDVIVNVPGGLRISEPAVDLALALAVVSSMRDVAVKPGVSAAAEVGLGGELRPVRQGERRAVEARRLGMDKVLLGHQPDEAAARREAKSGGRHFDGLAEAIAEVVPARRGRRAAANTDEAADEEAMRAARPLGIFT